METVLIFEGHISKQGDRLIINIPKALYAQIEDDDLVGQNPFRVELKKDK